MHQIIWIRIGIRSMRIHITDFFYTELLNIVDFRQGVLEDFECPHDIVVNIIQILKEVVYNYLVYNLSKGLLRSDPIFLKYPKNKSVLMLNRKIIFSMNRKRGLYYNKGQ